MSDYTEAVKKAVCKLLDVAHSDKHACLELDTDCDGPFVMLWAGGKLYKAPSIGQMEDDEISFLDCCEAVLKAYEEKRK